MSKIKKGVYGKFSKVKEEFKEVSDARKQRNKILELVELSDLVGAIRGYLENKFNGMTLDDLINMSRVKGG